jgi:hypothetical protein
MRQDEAAEGLDSARGAVRDALSALQNLFALLRSPKVGPKTIEALLPEIRANCETVGPSLTRLLADVRDRLPDPSAADQVTAFANARGGDMVQAVLAAERTGLDARARLALEKQVESIAPDLDAARGLTDLLLAALEEHPVEVDLAELLAETLGTSSHRASFWGPSAVVHAHLVEPGTVPVSVRPRVAIAVVALAVAHVHLVGKVPSPHLHARRVGNDVVVAVTRDAPPGAGEGDALLVRPPVMLAASAAVLRLAASMCAISIDLPGGADHASVTFPIG